MHFENSRTTGRKDFSGSSSKNPPANAGDVRDVGSVLGLELSPGGGHGNPLRILAWRIPWTEEPGFYGPLYFFVSSLIYQIFCSPFFPFVSLAESLSACKTPTLSLIFNSCFLVSYYVSSPCLLQLEKACSAAKTQPSQK